MNDAEPSLQAIFEMMGASLTAPSIDAISAQHPDIVREFQSCDPFKLAANIAVLMLLPELQCSCVRLETLAHLALLHGAGKRKPAPKVLRAPSHNCATDRSAGWKIRPKTSLSPRSPPAAGISYAWKVFGNRQVFSSSVSSMSLKRCRTRSRSFPCAKVSSRFSRYPIWCAGAPVSRVGRAVRTHLPRRCMKNWPPRRICCASN